MKKKTEYENLIKTLKDVKPELTQPDDFTNQIVNRLPKQQILQKKGITISDNNGRWNIFIGFRAVAAVAAVLLVGYFVFQQWEIMTKVSAIEDEINNQKYTSYSTEKEEATTTSHIKVLLQQQAKYRKNSPKKGSNDKESIVINKEVMKQLIQLLEQMDEENQALKEEILRYLPDTLKDYSKYRSKLL